jgi:hypothetical protein
MGEGTGYVSYLRCSVGVPGLAARVGGGCVGACVACLIAWLYEGGFPGGLVGGGLAEGGGHAGRVCNIENRRSTEVIGGGLAGWGHAGRVSNIKNRRVDSGHKQLFSLAPTNLIPSYF